MRWTSVSRQGHNPRVSSGRARIMAGYWIIRGNLRNQAALEEYAAAFQPLGQRYRVKIIAGRGQSKTVEGPGFGERAARPERAVHGPARPGSRGAAQRR